MVLDCLCVQITDLNEKLVSETEACNKYKKSSTELQQRYRSMEQAYTDMEAQLQQQQQQEASLRQELKAEVDKVG